MQNVTCFSQRDPRWQAEKLGSGAQTIGQAGCLLTAMASILVDCGVATDPHRLNLWLRSHAGYADDNLFVWGSVEGLGVDLADLVDCARVPAPVESLETALEAGCSVVCEVDYAPGGTLQRHWVRVVALSARSGWIMDPWQLPGGEMVDVQDYLAPGWDVGRGIFAAAVYTHNGKRVLEVMDRRASGHQQKLCIRSA